MPLLHAAEVPPPHAPQVAPLVPHDMGLCPEYASHVPAAVQHPIGHDVALHTHCPAVLHVCPIGHEPHIAPPVPHEPPDCAV